MDEQEQRDYKQWQDKDNELTRLVRQLAENDGSIGDNLKIQMQRRIQDLQQELYPSDDTMEKRTLYPN